MKGNKKIKEKNYEVSISETGSIVFHGERYLFYISLFTSLYTNEIHVPIPDTGFKRRVVITIRRDTFKKIVDFLAHYKGELDAVKVDNGAIITLDIREGKETTLEWYVFKLKRNNVECYKIDGRSLSIGTIIGNGHIHRLDKHYLIDIENVPYDAIQTFLSLYNEEERGRIKNLLISKMLID